MTQDSMLEKKRKDSSPLKIPVIDRLSFQMFTD